jgi:hypothetical protein
VPGEGEVPDGAMDVSVGDDVADDDAEEVDVPVVCSVRVVGVEVEGRAELVLGAVVVGRAGASTDVPPVVAAAVAGVGGRTLR